EAILHSGRASAYVVRTFRSVSLRANCCHRLHGRMTTASVLRILLRGALIQAVTQRESRTKSKCHHRTTFRKLRPSQQPQPIYRKSRPMSCVAPCRAEPPPPKPSPPTAASSLPSFVSVRSRH